MLLFAASAVLWTSCNDEDSCQPQSSDQIGISAVIAQITPNPTTDTRTSYSGSTAAWADGDALGLFCPQAITSASNIQFTVANTSTTPTWSTSTPIYWLDGTTAHKFTAYAPYAPGSTDATAVKLPALSTQTGAINAAQDFLISNSLNTTGVARSAGSAITLAFTHALSLVEFRMLIGVGIAANTTLTSFTLAGTSGEKLYTSDANSTIALATGAITVGTGTNTATITPAAPPTLTTTATPYYALILPGTYVGPTLTVNIKDGGTTAYTTATVPIGTTVFEAGKKYSYLVTISRTAITISSATITDWTTVNGSPITPGV